MTLRRRWALSIAAILALFALNLSVYLWGNARRSAALLAFKTELERKDLIVEIRNKIADRQREIAVMEPLLASGAVELDAGQRAEMGARIEAIERRIERLLALPGAGRTATLAQRFEQLGDAWTEVYAAAPEAEVPPEAADGAAAEASATAPAAASGPPAYEGLFARLAAHLDELELGAASDAADAEQRFARIAELTDRITLGIFVLSSLLAIGIAVWFARFLRGAFARYVTDEVVTNLLDTPRGLAIGGEKRVITVLMADLRGFTTMTDRQPAEDVVAALNTYLGRMTEIIVDSGGVIDEFIGDAILVFFGAPVERSDHAEAAVRCALRMQIAMGEVNDENRARHLPELEMGIGIHTGEAVVGNIGSTKRTKYGAVGTTVNLASRIQGFTVGGQVLASARTLDLVAANVRIDARLEIRPKGLEKAVEVAAVGGIDGESGLELPRRAEAPTALAEPIPVRLSLVDGARQGRAAWPGEITALAERTARVRTGAPFLPLDNVKLELPAGDDETDLWAYAKVLPGQPGSGDFLMRFTTVPPPAAAFLRSSLEVPT